MKHAEFMWLVLDQEVLTLVEDPDAFIEQSKTDLEKRLRRRDPDGSLSVEHTLYVRVGQPIDGDHLPDAAIAMSRVGDTVLLSVARPTFNERTLRGAIVAVWGAHGAHVDVYDALLKKAGLA